MMFLNVIRKKSDANSISLGQQTRRNFDFLSPALNIFLKGWPARRPNVLPISQDTKSLRLNCTASHVNVLRRTPGGCKEASRQKIKYPFK